MTCKDIFVCMHTLRVHHPNLHGFLHPLRVHHPNLRGFHAHIYVCGFHARIYVFIVQI
jgi:hypothetical protein